MPTVDAATTISAHRKPSGYNDGEGTTARDDSSGSAERVLPGAFPIAGPDGRRSGSPRDDEASYDGPNRPNFVDEEKEMEMGDGDANGAIVLVPEANLVTTSDVDQVPLVEGQAVVEQSAADRKRKQRRRLLLILGLVLMVAGIAVGVTREINSNQSPASLLPQSSPPSLSPSVSLSPSSSPAPSVAPTMRPNFRQFRKSLPNYTKMQLQNTSSPQYLAWRWLTLLDDTLNMELWKLRQRFALACFRFATTAFESYIVNQFSPLDVDECNWTGIVCNASGSVMQISLTNTYLGGSVPRELYFLSELTALNLTNNDFTDSYPLEWTLSSDLQRLSNLEVFVIAGNFLRGSIPTQLALLPSLIHLDLSNNRMTGTLPTHLCQLPNLRRLYLDLNELSGPIPTHLGNLSSSLRWLDLSSNSFTGALPSELGQLTLLKHLDLIYSFASIRLDSFPTELGRLSQLTYLSLNVLSSMTGSSPVSIPTEIFQLTRLESLYLEGVKGTVPTELGLLSQLKYLSLEIESVTGRFPTELGQLPLLESLEIWYSKSGTIPTDVGLMSRLTHLAIWDAVGTIPTTLGQLTLLESLDLSTTQLTGTIPTQLGRLTELKYLDLSYNKLNGTIPTELGLLSNLETLDMDSSLVTGSVPSEICQLASLNGGVLDEIAIDCTLVNCSCKCSCF